MFTIEYKGWYISGYFDKPECKVLLPRGGIWCKANSILSAKRTISRDSNWVFDKSSI